MIISIDQNNNVIAVGRVANATTVELDDTYASLVFIDNPLFYKVFTTIEGVEVHRKAEAEIINVLQAATTNLANIVAAQQTIIDELLFDVIPSLLPITDEEMI